MPRCAVKGSWGEGSVGAQTQTPFRIERPGRSHIAGRAHLRFEGSMDGRRRGRAGLRQRHRHSGCAVGGAGARALRWKWRAREPATSEHGDAVDRDGSCQMHAGKDPDPGALTSVRVGLGAHSVWPCGMAMARPSTTDETDPTGQGSAQRIQAPGAGAAPMFRCVMARMTRSKVFKGELPLPVRLARTENKPAARATAQGAMTLRPSSRHQE